MDFHIDTSGNLVLSGNDFSFTPEDQYNSVLIRMKNLKGECFLDKTLYVDWLSFFENKRPDLNKISAIIKSEILKVDGISRITEFNINLLERKLVFSFRAEISSTKPTQKSQSERILDFNGEFVPNVIPFF